MGAVSTRVRTELRRRARSAVLLVLAIAIAGGATLAAFAGARRTESAVDRFVAYSQPAQGVIIGDPDDVRAGAVPAGAHGQHARGTDDVQRHRRASRKRPLELARPRALRVQPSDHCRGPGSGSPSSRRGCDQYGRRAARAPERRQHDPDAGLYTEGGAGRAARDQCSADRTEGHRPCRRHHPVSVGPQRRAARAWCVVHRQRHGVLHVAVLRKVRAQRRARWWRPPLVPRSGWRGRSCCAAGRGRTRYRREGSGLHGLRRSRCGCSSSPRDQSGSAGAVAVRRLGRVGDADVDRAIVRRARCTSTPTTIRHSGPWA